MCCVLCACRYLPWRAGAGCPATWNVKNVVSPSPPLSSLIFLLGVRKGLATPITDLMILDCFYLRVFVEQTALSRFKHSWLQVADSKVIADIQTLQAYSRRGQESIPWDARDTICHEGNFFGLYGSRLPGMGSHNASHKNMLQLPLHRKERLPRAYSSRITTSQGTFTQASSVSRRGGG